MKLAPIVAPSPYALNDFEEIDMKENPEKMVPGYGYFWEGSLARVDRKSENGWFDLRVTLTDQAGNSQSQVISPAFHVDNMTGVAAPSIAKAQLSVMGHRIVASDGAEVEVYTLSGMRVANRDIAPGLYIARSGATSAKMSVR